MLPLGRTPLLALLSYLLAGTALALPIGLQPQPNSDGAMASATVSEMGRDIHVQSMGYDTLRKGGESIPAQILSSSHLRQANDA
jgi:hypothetical protein